MKAMIVPVPPSQTIPPLDEIRPRVRSIVAPEIWGHVLRTATLARELAEAHGVDPDRAEAAALLHDIADHLSEREISRLVARYDIELSLIEARVPALAHGKVGAAILRHEWGITDEDFLDAVRFHVSGSSKMGQLGKVLFLADKLEPERDKFYRDLDPIRELALTDLDQAVGKLYAWRVSELRSRGAPVHEDLAEAINTLTERGEATKFNS